MAKKKKSKETNNQLATSIAALIQTQQTLKEEIEAYIEESVVFVFTALTAAAAADQSLSQQVRKLAAYCNARLVEWAQTQTVEEDISSKEENLA